MSLHFLFLSMCQLLSFEKRVSLIAQVHVMDMDFLPFFPAKFPSRRGIAANQVFDRHNTLGLTHLAYLCVTLCVTLCEHQMGRMSPMIVGSPGKGQLVEPWS